MFVTRAVAEGEGDTRRTYVEGLRIFPSDPRPFLTLRPRDWQTKSRMIFKDAAETTTSYTDYTPTNWLSGTQVIQPALTRTEQTPL